MCYFLVKRDYTVLWKVGVDSHSELLKIFGIPDAQSEFDRRDWAKVEILNGDLDLFTIDETTNPDWWNINHRLAAEAALKECQKQMQMPYVVEYPDGTKKYYQNGQLHRLDGPAIERPDGTKKYYQNDQLHRPDGPAIEWANGTKKYYQNGLLHRPDGPAIVRPDGSFEYYQNGLLHRPDGPAGRNESILSKRPISRTFIIKGNTSKNALKLGQSSNWHN